MGTVLSNGLGVVSDRFLSLVTFRRFLRLESPEISLRGASSCSRHSLLEEELIDQFAVDVGEAVVAALEFEGELFVIDAEEVEEGGVEVVNADGILCNVVGVVVGFADGLTGFNAAAGEPHGEAAGVVVATEALWREVALAVNGASEFAAPDDEGVLKQAALLEVFDESG